LSGLLSKHKQSYLVGKSSIIMITFKKTVLGYDRRTWQN